MTWLLFYFSVEMGIAIDGNYTPVQYAKYYECEYYEQPMFIEFAPELELFGFVSIYGSARMNMYKYLRGYGFSPVSVASNVGVSVKFRGFSLNAEHYCKHPIVPWRQTLLPEQHDNMAYTQVTLKYDSREAE